MATTEQETPQEKPVQTIVPVPLWNRVKQSAKDERRLLSQQVTVLLERGLAYGEPQENNAQA